MTLTLQAIEAHIRNALGGDSSVEGNGRSIANQAGHYWADMHDWRCMERLGRLSLRASITLVGATWTESSRTLTAVFLSAPFANYTWVQGDEIQITTGTGAVLGFYAIQSRLNADAIELETSIGSGADAQSNIGGAIALRSVALPADFRQLLGSPVSVDSTRMLSVLSGDEVLESQSISGGFDTSYVGSIVWRPSVDLLGGAPVPVLELSGAPSANTPSAFRLRYRATWTDLSDDSDIAQIPSTFAMELLYLQVVRAVALGYEEFDMATMQARLGEIRGGPEFAAAVRADGSVQTNFGEIRGGAAGRRSGHSYSFTFLPPG